MIDAGEPHMPVSPLPAVLDFFVVLGFLFAWMFFCSAEV